MSDVLGAADRNMLAAWERIIALSPRPGRTELGGLLALSSGIPMALFNPTYVVGAIDDPAGSIAALIAHYAALDSSFALVFRDDVAPGLADVCAAAGMIEHWKMPLMVLDPIPSGTPEGAIVDGLEITAVDANGIDAYADVLSNGFGMPRDIAVALLGERLLLETPGFTGFLAHLDGEPVGASGVYLTDAIAGVYNVATLPAARGRGVGAAVTWAAVLAGRDAGATTSILQASEMGVPVYTRMGFATPAHYRQFEGVKPS